MNDKFDVLWKEYREACPDPEPTAQFMPNLWRRIEERRSATTSVFRRLVEVYVIATLAVVLVLAAIVIPRLQDMPVYTATTYVDVLAADHPNTYVDILAGDIK